MTISRDKNTEIKDVDDMIKIISKFCDDKPVIRRIDYNHDSVDVLIHISLPKDHKMIEMLSTLRIKFSKTEFTVLDQSKKYYYIMYFRQNNITNGRFELKYIADSSNFLIEKWIKQNFHPINIAFPKRKIHNLYFDNLDLECYEDNLSGISKRSKLRFRWFGNLDLVNNGTLEIKKKESSIGFKNRLQIKEKFSFKNKKWRDIKKIIKSSLKKNQEFALFF